MVGDGRFLVRHWVDGCVLFDLQSGDTHALDPLSCSMFLSFDSENIDKSPHIERMLVLYPNLAGSDIESQYDHALQHLTNLNLVKVGTP